MIQCIAYSLQKRELWFHLTYPLVPSPFVHTVCLIVVYKLFEFHIICIVGGYGFVSLLSTHEQPQRVLGAGRWKGEREAHATQAGRRVVVGVGGMGEKGRGVVHTVVRVMGVGNCASCCK